MIRVEIFFADQVGVTGAVGDVVQTQLTAQKDDTGEAGGAGPRITRIIAGGQTGWASEGLVDRLVSTVGSIIHATRKCDNIAIVVGAVVRPGLVRAAAWAVEQVQRGTDALGDGRSL